MITYIIIAITVICSYAAFQNESLISKCIFYPVGMQQYNQWWRFITHGFVHADMHHLVFNMLSLFFFGRMVENYFQTIFENQMVFPLFYISALIFSSIPSFFKHKSNQHYRSLGASGAVSAVLMASVLFDPWATILLKFIIPIPAILFAIGYIAYSAYMDKRNMDNIGHDAHLYGALYGFLFPLLFKSGLFMYFIHQLSSPRFLS